MAAACTGRTQTSQTSAVHQRGKAVWERTCGCGVRLTMGDKPFVGSYLAHHCASAMTITSKDTRLIKSNFFL